MIAAAVILAAIILAATVLVASALRRVVRNEPADAARILASDAHTVSYAVPHGVDVADLRVAATRGGFTTRLSTTGNHQCLQVLCPDSDRERLRHVLEEAHDVTYDGTALDLHPVVFEDERSG